ncbi:hypothetical protein HN873_009493 [Arachis hypogaea]
MQECFVKDVGRNDLAALIDSSQEVAKKSLEKAAECVRCLEEDMAKARPSALVPQQTNSQTYSNKLKNMQL